MSVDFSARDFVKNFEGTFYVVVGKDTITIARKDFNVVKKYVTLDFICNGEEVEIPFDFKENSGFCGFNVNKNGDYSFVFESSDGSEWDVFTNAIEALERAKSID